MEKTKLFVVSEYFYELIIVLIQKYGVKSLNFA